MMINCNKAGQLLEQEEFEKISWWKRRKLKLHLKICKVCADYEKDNKVLAKIIKMAGVHYSSSCMAEADKEKIKSHLAKHNH